MKRLTRRVAVVAAGFAALSVVGVPAASAHPLGNFTVNRYSGIVVGLDEVSIDHVVDYAEIPTVQERSKTKAGLPAYAAASCAAAAQRLELRLDDKPVTLAVKSSTARFLAGAAGLQTLRLECDLRADADVGTRTALSFVDTQATERVGWREVTLQGDGTTIVRSTVPTTSASKRLAAYPQDLLSSPLDQRAATATVSPGGARLESRQSSTVLARPTDRLSSMFTNLVGDGAAGPGVMLLAILLAIGIGSAHAVAPGHGKTVMAFYLAGERARSWRSAVTVGATVTATHTAGVLLLGLLVTVLHSVAPSQYYPILTIGSGLIVLVIGAGLVRRVISGRSFETGHVHGPGGHTHGPAEHGEDGHEHHSAAPHAHEHGHEHVHAHEQVHEHAHAPVPAMSGATAVTVAPLHDQDHHDHDHDHDEHDHHGRDGNGHDAHDRALSNSRHSDHEHGHGDHGHDQSAVPGGRRGLIAIGLAGGLVPSPSALVVLLGSAYTGHAWLGVVLVIFFGLGMAATLTTVGVLIARAGGRLQASSLQSHPVFARVLRFAPILAAVGVCFLGITSVVRGLAQLG